MSTILRAALDAAKRTKAAAGRVLAPLVRSIAATRGGRVAVALARFAWSHVPKWLRRTLAVCLAIPGPVDELAAVFVVAVFIAGPLIVSGNARRELATAVTNAWRAQ